MAHARQSRRALLHIVPPGQQAHAAAVIDLHSRVTDRGRVVAMLIPVPPAATLVERLVAEGRAIPATRNSLGLPPLRGKIPADLGKRLLRALQESRQDRL